MQVYFLCTGNSCRSQMAEGFARQLLGSDWTVASAGLEAQGLNSHAVDAMAECGIDISDQRSTPIDTDYLKNSDLVVTLCGDARDRCPATPANTARVNWPLPDPAKACGSEEDIEDQFRQVRDEIQRRVIGLATE